jgi:hypothetical protein
VASSLYYVREIFAGYFIRTPSAVATEVLHTGRPGQPALIMCMALIRERERERGRERGVHSMQIIGCYFSFASVKTMKTFLKKQCPKSSEIIKRLE